MADTIIEEEYLAEMEKWILNQGEQFETFLSEYIQILVQTSMQGIAEGKTAEALKNYIGIAMMLKHHVGDTSETAVQILKNYVADIDEADSYLY